MDSLLISILLAYVSLLQTIIGYFVLRTIRVYDQSIKEIRNEARTIEDEITDEVKEIKTNYLDRFEKLGDKVESNKNHITSKMDDMKNYMHTINVQLIKEMSNSNSNVLLSLAEVLKKGNNNKE